MDTEAQAAQGAEAPKPEDPRPQLFLALGERQYLMTKIAAEMGAITKKLDELNIQAQKQSEPEAPKES